MKDIIAGSTDQETIIRIVDEDGLPVNTVEHNTSGIDLWYRRDGGLKVSITEAALASADAAHSDGGIELIGNGYYRLDLPDAAVAAGSGGVLVGGTVTGMVVIGSYHALVDDLEALINAAAGGLKQLMLLDDGTAFALYTSGQNLFFRIFNNIGQVWDFTAKSFVALTGTSNDYIAATERTSVGGTGFSGYSVALPISELHTAGDAKGLVLMAYNASSPADANPTIMAPLPFSVQFGRIGAGKLTVQSDVSVKSTEGDLAQLKVWLDRNDERMAVGTAGGAVFTVNAGTDLVTSNSHGLSNGDVLLLTTSNALPGGLSAATPYFVRDMTTHTFKLAATSGGSAIDITSTGTGTHKWHKPTARLRLREHGAESPTFLFDQDFTAEHLIDNCFEIEIADPGFTPDRQYDVLAEVVENGNTHSSYQPQVVM